MHINTQLYSHFSGNNLMVLGHGSSFSSNTLPSISSVMCGGVLKKCSICTSQKSNLYAVQLKTLQEPKAQYHCFAHIYMCNFRNGFTLHIYHTSVCHEDHKLTSQDLNADLCATYIRIQELLLLKIPTLATTTTGTAQTIFTKNISLTVYKTNTQCPSLLLPNMKQQLQKSVSTGHEVGPSFLRR